MMPSAKDNKPCIDLVERKPKRKGSASGILRHLSEFKDTPAGKKKPPHNNRILVKQWVKSFGMKRGEQKKVKERWMRASSKQFYGNRKHDEVFHLIHYAGDIEYVM
jgi:myosin heavy subunit